jgi:hypothetical protein
MKHVAHETAVCRNPHSSSEIPARTDGWVTNTPSVKKLCPQKKLIVLVFSYKHNMLKCWSIKDMLSFMCILYKCMSASYEKLLFHE